EIRAQVSKELVPPELITSGLAQPELGQPANSKAVTDEIDAPSARSLARIAFWDIMVFFGVLLVGFAYLWKRGDLDWVRSTAAEAAPAKLPAEAGATAPADKRELVGAGT